MQPLDKTLRHRLERTIKDARELAEDAARAALEQLGVGEAAPFAHLSERERELRRKLRVHGRQLGDSLNGGKIQTMDRLIEEVAYEHWHRMLFARFLAENNLLMYLEEDLSTEYTESTEKGDKTSVSSVFSVDKIENAVAVTLEECADLAADEGLKNEWEMAARLAARMLPQIFRLDSPVFQLGLPPEHQQKLERLVAELELPVFTASDSLGWVYQFWQAKKKDEVNASEVKIGARELPAVTQLFTEPYMVSFLLDNSLGAWWAARRLTDKDYEEVSTEYTESTEIEKELRQRASIPGVPLEYLRFVSTENNSGSTENNSGSTENNSGSTEYTESTEKEENKISVSSVPSVDKKWLPAAGTFDGWPEQLVDLKTLDPCCGSGHFLVAAFLMLVPMRMERDGLSAREAVDAVLRENIHGLELDQRCVELAAFALALTAWKYPNAGGYRVLPELNVACSGLSISAKKEEWLALAGDNTNLRLALDELYKQFKDAPVLGSLINPEASLSKGSLFELKWEEVGPLLTKALAGEKDDEKTEMGVVARGLTRAASILADQSRLVMTNVPYLTRSKFSIELRKYTEKFHKNTNADLATAMIDRFTGLTAANGVVAVVSPQNWLFQPAYKSFREMLLKKYSWRFIARLGFGSFNTPLNAAPSLFIAKKTQSSNGSIPEIDVVNSQSIDDKREHLSCGNILALDQDSALKNKDFTLDRFGESDLCLLAESIDVFQGIRTGDKQRFTTYFWEIEPSPAWEFLQSTCRSVKHWDGLSECIRWENGKGQLHQYADETRDKLHDMHESGNLSWGRQGVTISQMGSLESALYSGERYDGNCATITPKDRKLTDAIWAFCSSKDYQAGIREIDQSIKVTNATLGKIPFDLDRWTQVAAEKYPNGLPKPYTDDPTQWIFHGHPCGSIIWDEEKKWTAHGPLRTDDSVLHVAVARLLGYRWPAELEYLSTEDTESTENEDKKHSVSSVDKKSFDLSEESLFWVKQCEELLPFADEDGIVCIPPVRGEPSASDRLLNLLAKAHFQYTSNSSFPCLPCIPWMEILLKSADHAGKSLETWLREKFFTQHCKLFQHRPFIWHIWDGLRDGFAALVNYHQLDAKRLETLIYTYLGDWISRQKQDIASHVDGAQERLAAAEALKKKLELILEGEAPYDIFVRWKPLEKQPIGWDPDLNDGVRLNIRPFLSVPDVGKKGAGVLRDKPNINWNKDRGKDVESAPWYHVFDGDRINDHHLTLAEKRRVSTENTEGTEKRGK